MRSLMISVSGVRGIVGEGLTPDIISRYATAFGSLIGGGTVVVGRDTRTTGPMLEHAVFAGLMAAGCRVLNIGVSATPTIQLAVEEYRASGGIAITASHNPQEWNAVKFMDRHGIFLDAGDGMRLLEIAESKQGGFADYRNVGTVENAGSFDRAHIEKIISSASIHADRVRKKKFRVAVDCVNGAGSAILPSLLEELGCDVVRINCDGNGRFSRGAEPLPENLHGLCEAVRQNGAAAGFACDPDADRLAVVDETGRPLGEEYTLVIAVGEILADRTGSVATNVSTTKAIDDVVAKTGGTVYRSKVGEVHVVRSMQEHNAVIGGEGNGGVIFPELHYGRDAMVGAALILQHMASAGKSLSEIYDALPQYYITKRKAAVDEKNLSERLESIAKKSAGATIDRTDGIKFIFPNYWVHLRKSNTEPVVRIIAESDDRAEAESVAEEYENMLTDTKAVSL